MNRFAPRPKTYSASGERKPFTWSYSKLKNYKACAKKHLEVDLLKNFEEPPSPQLTEGNRFHEAMKLAVSANTPLPKEFIKYQKWVDQLTRVSNDFQIIQVEQKLAMTRDYKPCGYFDSNVWFRAVIDYLKILPFARYDLAWAVDYKTGKLIEDPVQLALSAQVIFAHYPRVAKVRTDYFWTHESPPNTREDFIRQDMIGLWTSVLPDVDAMEASYNSGDYPVSPSGLCKRHCPVLSCAHNGRKE